MLGRTAFDYFTGAPLLAADTWLSRGGAYYVLPGLWVCSALFFSLHALRTYKDSDGCLLALGNFLLAFAGGGLGLLLLAGRFPLFVITSMIGTLSFPLLLTFWFRAKSRE